MLHLIGGPEVTMPADDRVRIRLADRPVMTNELAKALYVAFQQLRESPHQDEAKAA